MQISFFEHWTRSGCDYYSGVEFYIKYGQNNSLKQVFQFGPCSYTTAKLKSELKKLDYIKITLGKASKPKIVREKLPTDLQIEFDKLGMLIKEISFKNAQLELLPSNSVRAKYCSEIIKAALKRREIFNRIDYYMEHGVDLVKIDPKKKSSLLDNNKIEDLKNQLARLRSNRSKLSKNPTRVSDYNNICNQIVEIEKQLK